MQSDPSQLAANNQHGTTASEARAQDSKRKYQSFSTQLETIFRAAGKGIFCCGLQGWRKERRSKTKGDDSFPGGFLCLPRLGGWSDPAEGLLPAQMVLGGRAACPALLSPWLWVALSPAGHEITATWLHFNLHAEGMMFFSRLGGKHKAGSDNHSPRISGEGSLRSWLTLSLHFSRMCADVAMFPLSIFSTSRGSSFALSHRFFTLHLAKGNPEKSPR